MIGAASRNGVQRPLTGRHAFALIVAFFGVIFVANGALVFYAFQSWSGLTSTDAYREGIAYNRTLATAQRQVALGWRSRVSFDGKRVTLHIHDSDGAPLPELFVSLRLIRPVRSGNDVDGVVIEVAPGVYVADFVAPLPGRWVAAVLAHDDTGHEYRANFDLMVKP